MKPNLFLSLILAFIALPVLADGPFKEGFKGPIKADRERNSVAEEWVTKDMIAAFGEPALGASGKGPPCYRIFIQPESSKPTLIKYLIPTLDRDQAGLEVKQISKKDNRWELTFRKELKIRKATYSLLRGVFELSDPMRLPSEDWDLDDFLGGTCWVYEFRVPDGFIVLARTNPLGLGPEDVFTATGVSMERLTRELKLSSFVLMLCTEAGIEIDLPN